MFQYILENLWGVAAVLLSVMIIFYIGISIKNRRKINYWGRRVLILATVGLVLCFTAVFRDGYIDSLTGGRGLFLLDSITIQLAYAGGAVIGFAVLTAVIIRKQNYRKWMFYLLSAAIVFKLIVVEFSRLLV